MSWLDELHALERSAKARKAELEPLISEYREVSQLLDWLAEQPVGAEAAKVAAAPRKRARKPSSRRAKPARAAGGSRAGGRASTAAKSAESTVAQPSRRSSTGSSTRRAVRPGERERELVRAVQQSPGITVREIAQRLGVDATGLYGIVRRLERRGQLRKDGMKLTLVAGAAEPEPAAA